MGSEGILGIKIFLEHISQARASGRKYSDMEWHPASFFRTDIIPQTPFAILILNQPINENAFDAVRRHGTFSSLLQAIFFSRTRTRGDNLTSIVPGEKWNLPRAFLMRASTSSRGLDEIEISPHYPPPHIESSFYEGPMN